MANNKTHVECFDNVRKQLKGADASVGYVRFKLVGVNGLSGQYIEYSQTIKKKDGTEKTVEKKSYVTHLYCPFCGKKFK